jgi:hypothetical protein
MASVIGSELLYNGTEVYLDDILVYGDTPQEYLDNSQNSWKGSRSMVCCCLRRSAPSEFLK